MEYPIWINKAEELYKTKKSFAQIGRDLNVNRKHVSYDLKAKGYEPNHKFMPKTKIKQKTQKPINENIFEVIDTEEKAYWLGFLYADGCVNEKNNRVELALQEKDYNHIVKYKKFLNSSHTIGVKIKDKKYKSYRLSFSNAKIKNDLIHLGCMPNKTKKLKFPTEEQVPKKYIKDFIRGYLDADGCIRKGTTTDATIEILGYYNFLIGIVQYFNLKGHIYNFSHSDVKRFVISGKQAKVILKHLYNNSSIYLDRKYDKYLQIAVLGQPL